MAESVELASEHLRGSGEAEQRILFLHGMLGSGANLRTIARRFLAARPRWDAWLVDLRGHGASPKGMPGASLEAAARDVRRLCAYGLPVGAICGHSFGGKVALALLRSGSEPISPGRDPSLGAPLHIVMLDSNPGARQAPRDGDSALSVIELLATLPPRFADRAEFVAAVVARGMARGMAQWLAMSVTPDPAGGVRFGLDLTEMRALLESYFATDLWEVVESPPQGVRVHLMIGENSSSYSNADRARAIEIATRQQAVTVDFLKTGHWVHAEDPDGVVRLLLERIAAPK